MDIDYDPTSAAGCSVEGAYFFKRGIGAIKEIFEEFDEEEAGTKDSSQQTSEVVRVPGTDICFHNIGVEHTKPQYDMNKGELRKAIDKADVVMLETVYRSKGFDFFYELADYAAKKNKIAIDIDNYGPRRQALTLLPALFIGFKNGLSLFFDGVFGLIPGTPRKSAKKRLKHRAWAWGANIMYDRRPRCFRE